MTLRLLSGTAIALTMVATASSAAVIGHLNNNGSSQGRAADNLSYVVASGDITPADGADSYVAVDNTTYASMTPTELAAAYDVLVMPWLISPSVDFDWDTRILPYLEAGGSILWEEPNNIGELAASGVSLAAGDIYGPGVGPSGTISLDAPFGDDGAEGFYHIHYSITGHDASWDCWSTDINGDCHGVSKDFLPGPEIGGRMVIGVSDNLYHPNFELDAAGGVYDHYTLTENQINWLLTGSIDGTPTDPPAVPLPAAGWLLLASVGGLAAAKRRKKKS